MGGGELSCWARAQVAPGRVAEDRETRAPSPPSPCPAAPGIFSHKVMRLRRGWPETRWRSDPLWSVLKMHINMYMRTTLNLDDELIAEAQRLSGLDEKTAVVHEGLRALIAREKARRLARLGGSEPQLKAVSRRRVQRQA